MTKRISLDNGRTYLDAEEAIGIIDSRNLWPAIVNIMDDAALEATALTHCHAPLVSFLARYLALAPSDLILG